MAVTAEIEALVAHRKAHYVQASETTWMLDTIDIRRAELQMLQSEERLLDDEIARLQAEMDDA